MKTTFTTTPEIEIKQLDFRRLSTELLPVVSHYLSLTDSRTCDYTIGGLYLWADYFGYEVAVADEDMLIIRGRQENDLSKPAFSLPLGPERNVRKAVELLAALNHPLRFSAIPEDRLHLFAEVGCTHVSELGPDWSDYIYGIESFASLGGNAMKKKRNHVNRFLADNPSAKMLPLEPGSCIELLETVGHDNTSMGIAEWKAVRELLENWTAFEPYFEGRMLKADNGDVVAFTVGEVKGDTLHVHIEKADHRVSGSGETVAHLYCEEMLKAYPQLQHVNRQDNAGDEGLRQAKESWHPERLLPKFNVTY